MQTCPACGTAVPGSLADHGVAAHGVVRPPLVVLVCALLGLASALCLYQSLRVVPDLFDLLGDGELVRAVAAFVLMIVLVIGAYGAALGYVALLVWRGDRVGRVLAYVACGPIAVAGLLGDGADGTFRLIGAIALGTIAVLAFVPDVRAWFTGPFAAHHDEPSSVVAARALVAWTAFLAAVGTLTYLVVLTVDSGEVASLLLYGGAAVLLGLGFQRLPSGDPGVRNLTSIGAGLVLVATLVSGEASVGALAIAGPAIAAVVLLWTVEEATAHFGAAPIIVWSSIAAGAPVAGRTWGAAPGAPQDAWGAPQGAWGGESQDAWGAPQGAWGAPEAPVPPAPWTGQQPVTGEAQAPWPDPTQAAPAPAGWGGAPVPVAPVALDRLPPPAGAPWPGLPAPPSGRGTVLVGPDRASDPPPPSGPPSPSGRGTVLLGPDQSTGPLPSASGGLVRAGSTALPANRAALLLLAAGATATVTTPRVAWLQVRGATLAVLAGDRVRVVVQADDPERLEQVAGVAECSLQRDDPGFALQPGGEAVPRPEPPPAPRRAGWYEDPYRPTGWRRWDGAGWTVEVREG